MQRRAFLLTLPLLAAAGTVAAQAVRPVRLVVPYGAGSTPDTLGRVYASALAEELKRQVIVVNMPGAGAGIGHRHVAEADADGSTLLFTTAGPMAINPWVYKNLPYQRDDFVPIAPISTAPTLLMTRPGAPWNSLEELIAYAKAHPGRVTFASTGAGTTNHLSGMILQSLAGIELLHVPYKEFGQALTGVISGETDLMFYPPAAATGLIEANKLRALAVTASSRNRVVPSVATFEELGVPGFDVTVWSAIVAPAGLPPDVREALVAASERAIRHAAFEQQVRQTGDDLLAVPAADLGTFFDSEYRKWGQFVRTSGAVAD